MLSQATECRLRAAVVRFIDGVKNATGDHMARVQARDDATTADGCRRMILEVAWSDTMGNTRHAARTFAAEPTFRLDRFTADLDDFAASIARDAASGMLH